MKHNFKILIVCLHTACFLAVAFFTMADEAAESQEPQTFAEKNSVKDPAGREYFPKDKDNWFRPHLRAMGEPSLFEKEPKEMGNQFRFLYLPTFSKPISFRGFQADGRYYVHVVRLTGKGGYDPGKVELEVNVQITKQEWDTLETAVVRSFKETNLTDSHLSMMSSHDGSEWILEAKLDGKYFFQEVWEADYWTSKDGIEDLKKRENTGLDEPILFAFVAACNEFLMLTDFALPTRMVPTEFDKEADDPNQSSE